MPRNTQILCMRPLATSHDRGRDVIIECQQAGVLGKSIGKAVERALEEDYINDE